MKRLSFFLSIFVLLGTGSQAFAVSMGCGGPQLSISGGISSNPGNMAIDANPASIDCNMGVVLDGSVRTASGSSASFAGRAYVGGHNVGAGVGYDNSGNLGVAAGFGLGSVLQVGILGGMNVPNRGGWSFNLGGMVHLSPRLHLGALVYGLASGAGPTAYGYGLAYDIAHHVRFVTDYAFLAGSISRGILKPGIAITSLPVEVTFSYGINLQAIYAAPISQGVTVGAGLNLGRNVILQGYYNYLQTYMGNLVIML